MKIKRRQHMAVGFTSCPVSGCVEAPAGTFCVAHMAKVSVRLRSKIGRAMWAMRGRGEGALPEKLEALLLEAIHEINTGEVKT